MQLCYLEIRRSVSILSGILSQMALQAASAPPIDFSFLAGVNPELYHSIGKTLDAIYPGIKRF